MCAITMVWKQICTDVYFNGKVTPGSHNYYNIFYFTKIKLTNTQFLIKSYFFTLFLIFLSPSQLCDV